MAISLRGYSIRSLISKRKVRLGFYPYTYARVSVMKGNLIKTSEWHTYLKMSEHELMRTLQDGEYRPEMTSINSQHHSLAHIEAALYRGMMRACMKLKRISDPKVQQVLSMYFLRHDIENFLTCYMHKVKVSDRLPLIVMNERYCHCARTA